MKTNNTELQAFEKSRRSSEEKLKSLVIVILTVFTVGAGYMAYNQMRKNNELRDVLGLKEANAEYVAQVFQEIENNLAEIRSREGIIVQHLSPEEFTETSTPEERIYLEIAAIETLNNENNRLIDELNNSLMEKDSQVKGLKRSSAAMKKRLKEYKTRTEVLVAEAAALREELDGAERQNQSMTVALNYTKNEIEAKNSMLAAQREELEHQEKALQTAYYRVGTYKDLKNEHLVYKEGGIAGLASVIAVRPDADKEKFNEINIFDQKMIRIHSKEASILSKHDSRTYEFVQDEAGNMRWLKINDPKKFWEKSKYLVVVTKDQLDEEVAVVN
jgi:chromosome segregation ATPase